MYYAVAMGVYVCMYEDSVMHYAVAMGVCMYVCMTIVLCHVLCSIHGGIPRAVKEQPTEVQAIMAIPAVISVMPPYDHETEWMKQVATDCIWSDPASEDMEVRATHPLLPLYYCLFFCTFYDNAGKVGQIRIRRLSQVLYKRRFHLQPH